MTEDLRNEIVITYLKQLRLNRMARDCESLAREAELRGLGYLGYLQALLEGELAQRHEQHLRQRLKAAAFPYQKRLEDFDFPWCLAFPRFGSWSSRKERSWLPMRMCSSVVPVALGNSSSDGFREGALLGWLAGAVSTSGHASHRTGSRSQRAAAATVAGSVSPF